MFTAACPSYAIFLGCLGIVFAVGLTCFAASYGTAKAGVGILTISVMRPDLIFKALIPVILSGAIPLFGLLLVMMVNGSLVQDKYPLFKACCHLAGGLCVGLCGLAAGFSIGITGDSGVRAYAQQPRSFVGMVIILILSEALTLYGLIAALVLNNTAESSVC